MANKNRKGYFFDEDTQHGRVKRIMYKKYIQAYIEKTQNEKFSLRSIFIDGFAGAGRYGNDWPNEIDAYGSPLISLMVALGFYYKKEMKKEKKDASQKTGEAGRREEKADGMDKTKTEKTEGATPVVKNDTSDCSPWGWPASELTPEEELSRERETHNRRAPYCDLDTKIFLIFIESNRKNFSSLSVNVELLLIKFLNDNYPSHKYGFSSAEGEVNLLLDTSPFSISVKIINRKFEDTDPPPALSDPGVRSLTFLDPFGFTHTPMSHVKQFAPGPGNEVFINFMSSYVNRFVSRSTEGVKRLYGFTDFELEDVGRWYGIDPPDLKDTDDLADFVRNIIHSANENEIDCSNVSSCTKVYESFLKKKTNSKFSLVFEVKNKRNSTLYHMVHITNHIKGVQAMKEAMNRCSQRGGEMIMSEYDILRNGLVLNLCNLDDQFEEAENIYKQFRGKKEVRREDIEYYVLFQTQYIFRKKPLAILQKKGLITEVVDTKGNRQKMKNTFPDEVKKTKEKICWLLSFSDENYEMTSEKEGERVKPPENRERNTLKDDEERARKKEERKKVKTKRPEEERLEKERKKEERRKRKEAKLDDQRRKKEAKLENQRRKEEAKLVAKRRKEELENKRMRNQRLITETFHLYQSDKNKKKANGVAINSFGDVGCHEENKAPVLGELNGEMNGKETQNRKEKGNMKEKMQQGDIFRHFSIQKRRTEEPPRDKCNMNITDDVSGVKRKRKSRSISLENRGSKKFRSESE